ncbi:MAG: Prolipoprotein diacylglyceryl transferase [Bacteroidota bacterium]
MINLFIEWNADPTIINLLGFPIRWYGLCFAFAFLAGFQVVAYMFKKEGRPVEQADQLLIYTMVGTVAGARMGHYFFYEFPLLLADPVRFFIQMITPPFSGLASHGAAIGLFTAYYLYTKKNKDQSYLYVTDRIVIAAALAGFFIRFGNLMNSEIIGKPTDLPWGFKFMREALSCLVIFTFLLWMWNRQKQNTPHGILTGLFMIILFTLRFFYEFLKENQSSFEDGLSLNMGQILSIPAVLFGVGVLLYAKRKTT